MLSSQGSSCLSFASSIHVLSNPWLLSDARHRLRSVCTNTKAKAASVSTIFCKTQREEDPNQDLDDDQQEEFVETPLSRRVFIVGTLATSAYVLLQYYRLFYGEQLETTLERQIARRFPNFLSPTSSQPPTRKPVDRAFATAYFDALRSSALDLSLVPSSAALLDEEIDIRKRAVPLFFPSIDDDTASNLVLDVNDADFSSDSVFNFFLYARLHAIAEHTSPRSRLQLMRAVASLTLPRLWASPGSISLTDARERPKEWLLAIQSFLQNLVSKGWIAKFSIEPDITDFDSAAWIADDAATLVVWVYRPFTMESAQLMAGESYEEMAPKVSPWLQVILAKFGINAEVEDYYIDDVYHRDTSQYRPSVIASQMNLYRLKK